MSNLDITNKQMLEKLMQAIESIKEEGIRNKEELKQDIQSGNKQLSDKITVQATKISTLSDKCDQLEIRCSNLERLYRKNNVIIYGLELPKGNNILTYTIETLNKTLGLQLQDTDINNIYTLKSNNNKTSPIKIEFLSYLKKSLVFKNRTKLKGTQIFIAHDLSIEERKEHSILVKHLKLARSKNYSASIKGKSLKINDEIYTLEQLREIDRRQEDEENTSDEETSSIEYQHSTQSAPSTPTTTGTNVSELFHQTKNTKFKTTNQKDIPTKSSPADPEKEVGSKKVLRTFSNSSARSENLSDRVTRNKQKLVLNLCNN